MFLTPLTPAGKISALAGRRLTMQKYVCNVCGYEYDPAAGDPDSGIAPGTAFEDLPKIGSVPSAALPSRTFPLPKIAARLNA